MVIEYTVIFICLTIVGICKNWYLIHIRSFPVSDYLILDAKVILIQCILTPVMIELEISIWLTYFKDHFASWNWLVIGLSYSLNQMSFNDTPRVNFVKMVSAFFFRSILDQVQNFWVKILFHIVQTSIYIFSIQKTINSRQITTRKRSYSANDCMGETERQWRYDKNYFLKGLDRKVACDSSLLSLMDERIVKQFKLNKKRAPSKNTKFHILQLVDKILQKIIE